MLKEGPSRRVHGPNLTHQSLVEFGRPQAAPLWQPDNWPSGRRAGRGHCSQGGCPQRRGLGSRAR
eukprot:9666232-Alexandrium_andersonii.AAC.1